MTGSFLIIDPPRRTILDSLVLSPTFPLTLKQINIKVLNNISWADFKTSRQDHKYYFTFPLEQSLTQMIHIIWRLCEIYL